MVSYGGFGSIPRPYVGSSDIAMMYSVGDFSGLNRLTRQILTNAANAMAGMCSLPLPLPGEQDQRPLLAATMSGVTTPCVNRVRQLMDARSALRRWSSGATGVLADRPWAERLIKDGFIRGVLDVTTTELADELARRRTLSWPGLPEERREAWGLPQVISVGALDMVNFGPRDSVPAKYSSRTFYQHNATVTLMRTTREENALLGEMIARKANAARGPVTIVLPLRGISAIDCVGRLFHLCGC